MSTLAARGRILTVLALIASGGVLLGAAVAPWRTVAVEGAGSVAVTGSQIAAGLVPIALTLAVLGLAVSLAPVVLARVLGGVAVLVAGLAAMHLASSDATAAIERAAAALTGITTNTITSTATAWSTAAWAGATLGGLAGIWALVAAGRWRRRVRAASRFERVESGLAWDALDEGVDPTQADEPADPPTTSDGRDAKPAD